MPSTHKLFGRLHDFWIQILNYGFLFNFLSHERTNFTKISAHNTELNRYLRRNIKSRKPLNISPRKFITPEEVEEKTGIFYDDFEQICTRVKIHMRNTRKYTTRRTKKLSIEVRVLLVLDWLRNYPRLSHLRDIYGISVSSISRDIHFILPKIFVCLQIIEWKNPLPIYAFEGVSGAVDGSAHFRNRVHPHQADYYRRDKGGFFYGSQIVCSLDGEIYRVDLALGHNNDQGVLKLSGLANYLEKRGIKLLADRGYHHSHLIVPENMEKTTRVNWNNKQKGHRSVVESVIGYIKRWEIARGKFVGSPELHQIALMTVFNIANKMLVQFPIRNTEIIGHKLDFDEDAIKKTQEFTEEIVQDDDTDVAKILEMISRENPIWEDEPQDQKTDPQ